MLIAFAAYLASPKFAPGSPAHAPFPEWMRARPELRSILARMLRRNALAALELYHPGARRRWGPGAAALGPWGGRPEAGRRLPPVAGAAGPGLAARRAANSSARP
jgi:hypothetical protein